MELNEIFAYSFFAFMYVGVISPYLALKLYGTDRSQGYPQFLKDGIKLNIIVAVCYGLFQVLIKILEFVLSIAPQSFIS